VDVGSAVGSQREAGQGGDAGAGGDEGLDDDHIVADGGDAWGEACLPAHGGQLVLASFAAADPGGVAMVRDAVVGSLAYQVDRVVDYVDQWEAFFLGRGVGVPEDECDVDHCSRKPALCPLSYAELVPTAGVEPARRPGFEDRRSVQLSYAGIGVAGGTCTRHLGAGNAAFCSLNYGHMVTAGGVAPPTSTVSAWRSAVELRSAGALGRCCPSGLRSVGAALCC
jgi:hypothetical protein